MHAIQRGLWSGFLATGPMSKERNALMIVAHVVWGACLGYAERELKRRGEQMLAGNRKAPLAE